jgi:hypothetical protein
MWCGGLTITQLLFGNVLDILPPNLHKGHIMNIKILLTSLLLLGSLSLAGCAKESVEAVPAPVAPSANVDTATNAMDELDPFAENIDETLNEMDQKYFEETGLSPFVETLMAPMGQACSRATCPVWIKVDKSEQRLYLYRNGALEATWAVSTGIAGRGTPNFDKNPNGRIYDRYTSTKFPGGDYKGLGNMPYAIFIEGGFAIHGTGTSNWRKLGQTASHGCIRIHPDNAYYLNRLVRQTGIYQTWITVQQ